MPDHAHVAVSIPPSIAISTFGGRMKGAASHLVNHTNGPDAPEPFAWQAEYGILSFGEKSLPDVVAYVETQEARHATNRLSTALDRSQPQRGFVGSARGL
jgi:putative transposase